MVFFRFFLFYFFGWDLYCQPCAKGGENVENFDQVEKEVDTIDLYDDDDEEEEKEKAKKEEKSEVEFGKNLSLCFYTTGISQSQILAESKTLQFGIMDFRGFFFRAMSSLCSELYSESKLVRIRICYLNTVHCMFTCIFAEK